MVARTRSPWQHLQVAIASRLSSSQQNRWMGRGKAKRCKKHEIGQDILVDIFQAYTALLSRCCLFHYLGAGSDIVKAPGNLVVSAYVTCPDITQVVTPDFKAPGASKLLHVDLGTGRRRLGGSALAQAYMQVGEQG